MMDIGRMCLKIAGREAGNYCVVVKKLEDNFVMVTGPKDLTTVKRRRCNIKHLEPILEKLEIKEDASDEEVKKAYEKSGIFAKLQIKIPSASKATSEKPEMSKKPEKQEKKHEHKQKEAKKDKVSEKKAPEKEAAKKPDIKDSHKKVAKKKGK